MCAQCNSELDRATGEVEIHKQTSAALEGLWTLTSALTTELSPWILTSALNRDLCLNRNLSLNHDLFAMKSYLTVEYQLKDTI